MLRSLLLCYLQGAADLWGLVIVITVECDRHLMVYGVLLLSSSGYSNPKAINIY